MGVVAGSKECGEQAEDRQALRPGGFQFVHQVVYRGEGRGIYGEGVSGQSWSTLFDFHPYFICVLFLLKFLSAISHRFNFPFSLVFR